MKYKHLNNCVDSSVETIFNGHLDSILNQRRPRTRRWRRERG